MLSDPERRKYYDRTGKISQTVEEDFLEGFGRPSGPVLQATAESTSGEAVDNAQALQTRFSALQEQSHTKSFEAWMRSRNTANTVVTPETLMQDKKNISVDSYEKVRLPKVKATCVIVRDLEGDAVEKNTEVVFQRVPKELDWKEVLVNVQAAPISTVDAFVARAGPDALFRDDVELKPPFVLGFTGVGVVEAVGPGARDVEPGDWVVPARDGLGTMRSLAVWEEKDYLVVPKEIMPLEYMALHRELALAYHLMQSKAKELKPGDALIVNAANGAVGQTIVQLCRLMNIRAIAVIRRHDNFADTKAWLEFLGADKVFADDEGIAPALKAEYASLPTLAFDGVGGVATLKLMRALAPGSRIVSYGFIGARTISIPWQVIVNSRVTIEGFSLTSWIAEDRAHRKKFVGILEAMAKLINAGKLRISLEEMPIDQWFDGLAAAHPGMNTRIVLRMLTLEGERMREQEKRAEEARKQREAEAAREALRVAVRELFVAPPPAPPADAPPMKFYEVVPQAPHATTLVWLHGNGELPQEYTAMFDRAFLKDHPHVRLVLPTPPRERALVTDPQLWFDLDESAWQRRFLGGAYDSAELSQADFDVMQQIEEAADWAAACVEQELRRAPASRVVLAGFAHGGVVASYAAYTKLSAPIAGCVTIGAPVILPQLLAAKVKEPLRGVPLHCLGGAADSVFEPSSMQQIVEGVLAAQIPGAAFENVQQGQHEVGGLEIGALAKVFNSLTKGLTTPP